MPHIFTSYSSKDLTTAQRIMAEMEGRLESARAVEAGLRSAFERRL